MKNFRISFLLLTLLLCSCRENNAPEPRLKIENGAGFLSLDAQPRSGALAIRAAEAWSVTRPSQDDWLTLNATTGVAGSSQLGIRVAANEGAARSTRLTFACGEELFEFVIAQSAHEVLGFDQSDYCFYATFGTLPTLYAGLHVLSHDKPSYVFYQRLQTFDPALFPPHVISLSPSGTGMADGAQIDQMAAQMKAQILEINRKDPAATFGLYVDDLRCRVGYDWFVAQGIDSTRVRVSLLSDGTATYHNFYNYFGNAASAQSNWEGYAAQVEALDWNHTGRFPVTRSIVDLEAPTWAFYLSTRPGYRLILQNKALLESSGAFMQTQQLTMQCVDTQPYDLLAALPADARQRFYRMASFDYDHFAALFDASPRPNLVIIGTNASGTGVEEQQRSYVARVVAAYGTQYDIFFKPHPADTSSADYQSRFGLTLLPGQMPFEIFVWSLLDRIELIGGYPSTVFLSVPTNKVRFVFAPDAASLVRPLNLLFRDAEGVEWIN